MRVSHIIIALIVLTSILLTTTSAIAAGNYDYDVVKSKFFTGEELTPGENVYWRSLNGDFQPGPVRGEPHRDREGGPDDHGYTFKDSDEEGGPEFEWIDVPDLDGARQLEMSDDRNTGLQEFGFDVPYYDDVYNSIAVCSNGWASFTNTQLVTYFEADFDNGNWPNRTDNFPEAVLGIHITDLNPNVAGAVWFWTNGENQAIISWIDVAHYRNNDIHKTFQIILNSNGLIFFQYHDDGWPDPNLLIGFQNEARDDGLRILYSAEGNVDNEYLYDGLCIRIGARMGSVTGRVIDLETEEPIAGAEIELSDGSSTVTDDEGLFLLEEIVEDVYSATAWAPGYNAVISEEFEVLDEQVSEVIFSLPHPEIRVDPDGFNIELPQQGVENQSLTIFNEGNGLLEFWSEFTIPVRRDNPGDIIFEWPGSEMTGDNRLKGITSVGDEIFVSGANNSDNPNMIYVFNMAGELTRSFEQPVEEPSSNGIRGLCSDGEFLYGADGRVGYQFTGDGELVSTFPAPINPTTSFAYDPESGHLWASGTTNDIVEIDIEGNVISELEDDHRKYGLAWHPSDPDGYNLYVFHHVRDVTDAMVTKVNIENGEEVDVIDLTADEGDEGVDLFITDMFNPLVWMYVTIMEMGVPDVIRGVELDLNTSWVEVDPMEGTVDPDSELDVSFRFNAGNWMPGVYELLLVIGSNAAGDDIEVSLTLNVTDEGIEMEFFEFLETERRHSFVINSLSILEEPAEFGDEIGVFTPEGTCVGGSVWFDQVTTVPAFGDDPDTDFTEGFFVDDPFAFRVWDADGDRDYAANFELIGGDESFSVDGNTRGTLDVPNLGRVLQYDLPLGWSMISTNVILEEDDVVVMFVDLAERETLTMVKDGQGRFYSTAFGFNNIPFWNELEGYLLKLVEADGFELAGDAIDPATVLELPDGWSMISYIPQWEMDAPTAFEPLGENLLIAKDGEGRFYVPAFGFTNMGDLSEMNGYQVKLDQAQDFAFPQANMMAAIDPPTGRSLQYFGVPTISGENMSLLMLSNINVHTEIGIFDSNDNLCGAGVINSNGETGIAVWGDDPTTQVKDGFAQNEQLRIVSWNEMTGSETIGYNLVSGSDRYSTDGFTVLELNSSVDLTPTEFGIVGNYPNPFNDQSIIYFGVPERMLVKASLYNVKGQKVKDILKRTFSHGIHSVVIKANDLATGTYIVRLESGEQSSIQKIVLMR
ncbi:MAG: T9SS type A sorting domain-containing protein [Calditrichaeota bacterium]|nr:T9SS type A sorting domain-containing protein [Calditrichota bacterium]